MKYIIISFLISFNFLVSAQIKKCNKSVAFKKETKLLPQDFCMPVGFWVVDVQDVDLNCDGLNDRVIQYNKKGFVCGDTVFYDLFFLKADSSYKYVKTISNINTPRVSSFDYDWLKENCSNADDLYWYIYVNDDLIEFKEGVIEVGFAINEEAGYKFFFTYCKSKNNWYLSQKQKWDFPEPPEPMRPKLPSPHIFQNVTNGISIDGFNIRDYLEPL
ncbi:hypothetical protein [Labilibacter marinus]|uniref:hypothetical protein n=1 Tax=Labilibacter marinus TaxID=1477105 RepID=UPI00094FA114|nr:hypothetical protein [Labilibacter marinus]